MEQTSECDATNLTTIPPPRVFAYLAAPGMCQLFRPNKLRCCGHWYHHPDLRPALQPCAAAKRIRKACPPPYPVRDVGLSDGIDQVPCRRCIDEGMYENVPGIGYVQTSWGKCPEKAPAQARRAPRPQTEEGLLGESPTRAPLLSSDSQMAEQWVEHAEGAEQAEQEDICSASILERGGSREQVGTRHLMTSGSSRGQVAKAASKDTPRSYGKRKWGG